MISIKQIREIQNEIIIFGNHEPLIQSILDFDYLSEKTGPSVIAIVTGHTGYAKYFWGRREVLIPTITSLNQATKKSSHQETNYWFLNLLSGRRTLSSTLEILDSKIPASPTGESPLASNLVGGSLFAENVPELHSLQIISAITLKSNVSPLESKLIVGPASVGLLVPGSLKLGPIGGITPDQITETHLIEPGHVAVMSASGGMTNELINVAVSAGHRLSFALSFGGDRFPILSPREAFILAEQDPETETVLYYGELGGEDEYELVKLQEEGKFTKQVVAHIAGTVADLFTESPQFGHAKAKADNARVTARAKRDALRRAGFQVSNSFSEFINLVSKL
jgi:succinyl-CoA synthetase alpha subunit